MKNNMIRNLLATILMICTVQFVNASEISNKNPEKNIDSLLAKVELIPIMINGDKDNRINIVIMNRWTANESEPYNSPKMRDEFIKDINESIIAALTPGDERAQTAYANYREFFNVYGLWYPDSPEWEKGIDGNIVDAMRDKLFLPWKDEHLGWVTFLVMPNLNKGGGGAARNLEARVGRALIAGNGIGKMLHEIAHTCMSIGDEYTAAATGTTANPTYTVSTEYERDKINWRKWIEPDTPLPTPYTEKYKDKIGAFEGAQYHLVDYYRSTAQGCIMGAGVFDNTEKMCPICEQRVAMRVYKLVNPINSFNPINTKITIDGKTKMHFEIDHITPTPNTQVVRWILNGKTIATGVDEIDVEFGGLANYELTCSLTDETPFIRPDPPFAQYPKREIFWKISNTSPTSKANDLLVKLQAKQEGDKSLGEFSIISEISGGKPPYSLSWSTGSTAHKLDKVGNGIYELVVIDSEFRKDKAEQTIYASSIGKGLSAKKSQKIKSASKVLNIETEITASEKGRNNGTIAINVSGGVEPYQYKWSDGINEYDEGRIYEAEDASIKISGHLVKEYFDASNNKYITFNDAEGSIAWNIEVTQSGTYPIDIVYAGITGKGTPMKITVNGKTIDNALMFYATRPLFTGWEKATVTCKLNEGTNTINLASTGKSGANIDYLRVPANYNLSAISGSERIRLAPGDYNVTVTDAANNSFEKSVTVTEVYPFEINKLEIESTDGAKLRIVDPLSGYIYKWYINDAPLFQIEKYEKALFTGTEFAPPAPGNYYVSAKNKLSNTESCNRIGIAVDKIPANKNIDEMSPSALDEESILLWFDSSDLDGDENRDGLIPKRGPLPEWKEKNWRNPGKILTKYEPNRLNGMGVCAFDNVWISNIGKKVSGIQTIMMVYKESTMTFPGKSPFRELNGYIGKSSDTGKRLFDPETTDAKTKNGKVFLNGKQVDPFNTPNPMDFCVLTVEFESAIDDLVSIIEGFWEGDIAEMIFLEKPLSETERKGMEEYLRKKWFSAVDLNF